MINFTNKFSGNQDLGREEEVYEREKNEHEEAAEWVSNPKVNNVHIYK